MPLSISSAPRQLGDGNSVGTVVGGATNNAGLVDNLAFFGGTPVPQLLQGSLKGANGVLTTQGLAASPASVIANTTGERSFTVGGVASTDMVLAAIKPTSQAGLIVGTARVSATNTIQITFGNATAAAVTPVTTETYEFVTVNSSMQFPAVVLTPASVAAATSAEQLFTVTGMQPGMFVAVNKPTVNAGVVITNVRVSAVNQVGITFQNCTAAAVTPTAGESYSFFGAPGMRVQPVMSVLTVALSPASVAANTSAEQTFTVAGILASTAVAVEAVGGLPAGLGIGGARVSALNTLAINFSNTSAAAITPIAGSIFAISYYPNIAPATGVTTTQLSTIGVEAGGELARMNWLG